jgi:hypothetical protein
MSDIVLVRTRKNGSEYWVESYEDGSWRFVGQAGTPEDAEQIRFQVEDVRMAKANGIW